MKPQKDIFDLFRDNEHKLQEQPSREAWGKLERKLDRQRGRRRGILPLRNYLFAASVVGLLVVLSLLSGIFEPTDSSTKFADNQGLEVRPLEDLVVSDDQTSAEALIEFQRTYEERVKEQPIDEGSVEQKLVVRP